MGQGQQWECVASGQLMMTCLVIGLSDGTVDARWDWPWKLPDCQHSPLFIIKKKRARKAGKAEIEHRISSSVS